MPGLWMVAKPAEVGERRVSAEEKSVAVGDPTESSLAQDGASGPGGLWETPIQASRKARSTLISTLGGHDTGRETTTGISKKKKEQEEAVNRATSAYLFPDAGSTGVGYFRGKRDNRTELMQREAVLKSGDGQEGTGC